MLIVFKANHQSLPFIEVKSICILTIFVQDKREDTEKKIFIQKLQANVISLTSPLLKILFSSTITYFALDRNSIEHDNFSINFLSMLQAT